MFIRKGYFFLFYLFLLSIVVYSQESVWKIPISIENRHSIKSVKLTKIGQFGLLRKDRPSVPAHLHTGIDIKRPQNNYDCEPVYPASMGIVVSIRDDGPFAQIILVHNVSVGQKVWTVYEHVAKIQVEIGDSVETDTQIACFMSNAELDKYGWQFDHIHFEILKKRPLPIVPTKKHPQRLFTPFSLHCFNQEDLDRCYYNPTHFFDSVWATID